MGKSLRLIGKAQNGLRVSEDHELVARLEDIVAVEGAHHRICLLDGEDIHAQLLAGIDVGEALARPLHGAGDLEDGVLRVDVDIVDDVLRVQPHGELFGDIAVGVDDLVGAHTHEELALDLGSRPRDDPLCPQVLEVGRDLERSLKIFPDGDDTGIIRGHIHGAEAVEIHTVRDEGIRILRRDGIDRILALVHDGDFVAHGEHLLPERAPELSHSYE